MLYPGTRFVMGTRRRRAADPSSDADLVTAFARHGLDPTPTNLRQWELGPSAGSARLLRAYEDGCGLPPYLLFALNDRQRRAEDDAFATVPTFGLTTDVWPDQVYEVLDAAVAGEPVSGSAWYALAAFAADRGHFYLSRSDSITVSRRLLEDLARSVGAGYVLRFEAAHLLASVTRLDGALIEEFAALVSSDDTGMLGDAVSMLLRPDPDQQQVLVDRLRHATSPAAQEGLHWIDDILRDRDPAGEPALDPGEVEVRSVELSQVLPTWTRAPAGAASVSALLAEALGGRSRLKRHEASLLLMVLELQETLGPAVLDLVEQETDLLWRTRLAHLHEYLMPPTEPGRLERMALREPDPEVRRALWNARGHSPVPLQIEAGLAEVLDDPVLRAPVISTLGLTGSVDADLLARPELAPDRHILAWWQRTGPALHL